MHLELEPDIEPVGQNPLYNFTRIDPAEDWREQHRVTPGGQIELAALFT